MFCKTVSTRIYLNYDWYNEMSLIRWSLQRFYCFWQIFPPSSTNETISFHSSLHFQPVATRYRSFVRQSRL